MKLTMMEMIDASYSDEYRNWAIEAYGASLESVKIIMDKLVGFEDYLEEYGYVLAI